MAKSWGELGARVLSARKAARLTQDALAAEIGLDRTAISKIESGTRSVDSLELARLAKALSRPVAWFVTDPPPSVVSRRGAMADVETDGDVLLETIASDVAMLVEAKLLEPATCPPPPAPITDVVTAEAAARDLRRQLGKPSGPIIADLLDLAERVGLYVFVLELPSSGMDGSYVALERGGVALVQGSAPVGRRRFTAVHELGHHYLADSYSAEWVTGGDDARERLINAFAIHFLAPRESLANRWREIRESSDERGAALTIAAEYGLSWTALCSQLRNLLLIDEDVREELEVWRPTRADYLERSLEIVEAPPAVALPRGFSAAVIKGFRSNRLSRERALELLRGTVGPDELGVARDVPLEGMLSELRPL